MIRSLLVKELVQHGVFVVFAQVLLALGWVTALSMGLLSEQDSLFRSCADLAYVAAPMLAWMLALRLVVREYVRGNDLFLSALPVPIAVRSLVKIGFGLAVMAASFGWIVVVAGLLTQWREVVGPGWVLQALWQVEVYGFAWFGLAFGVAHLGRFRNAVVYPGLLCILVLYDEAGDVMRSVDWLGTLLEPLDTTLHAPPYGEIPLALAWGLAGLAAGVWLASRDGGTRARLSFRPLSSIERSGVLGGGLGAILLCTMGPDLVRREASPPVDVRAVGEGPQALVDEVRRLRAEAAALTGAELPAVVLLPGDPGDVVPVAQPGLSDARLATVRVPDSGAVSVRLAGVMRAVFQVHVAASAEESTLWALDGLAGWLAAGSGPHVLARRGAWALQQAPDADLERWRALEVAVGEEVRLGLAWAGWAVLGESERREVAQRLVGSVGRSPVGLLLLGPRRGALDPADHMDRVRALLASVPSPAVELPRVVEVFEGALSATGADEDALWLRPLHELHDLEADAETPPWRLMAREVPLTGVPVSALDGRTWQATVARRVESLDGHVISGWQQVSK